MKPQVDLTCNRCGKPFSKTKAEYEYRLRVGATVFFCSHSCASHGHMGEDTRTPEQKRADKSAYDKIYRAKKLGEIKARKAAYYAANADREKEAEYRKRRMPLHIEYCRRPEYRAKKHVYDRKRTDMNYGDYAECNRLLMEIETIIRTRTTKYQRLIERGYFQRVNERKRERRRLARS